MEGDTLNWYPRTLTVGATGNGATLRFLKDHYAPDRQFDYAEFGIYKADTAREICESFPGARIFLFDFQEAVDAAREKLAAFPNEIHYFGNTQRFNDSYNWSLMKLIERDPRTPIFDYCFLDGAHTVAVDALTFFLCDRLLRVGGHMDFDDYKWRIRNSSLDPRKVPAMRRQYTGEQINAFQVKMIVDSLVRPDRRYREVVPNKVFQKIA
jgi:hypothetical protein